MKATSWLSLLMILSLAFMNTAMSRQGQYDEEARTQESYDHGQQKATSTPHTHPAKRFVSGVKEATIGSTTGFIADTVEGTRGDAPIIGTLEGVRLGSGKVLDRAVRGAVKVATLGYAEVGTYEVTQPKVHSDESTKITFKIPGT